MATSNFDKDIKGVSVMGTDNPTLGVRRVLTLSNASNETGAKAATANIFAHQ